MTEKKTDISLDDLSDEEAALILDYKLLDKEQREAILSQVKELAAEKESSPAAAARSVS